MVVVVGSIFLKNSVEEEEEEKEEGKNLNWGGDRRGELGKEGNSWSV